MQGIRFFARLVLALALVASTAAQGLRDARREVIVEVPRAMDRLGIEARFALAGCAVLEELPALGLLLVALPDGISVESAVTGFGRLPGVGFAEPNGTGQGGDILPNDTWFPFQWPHENTGQVGGSPGADIDARHGWELARGSPGVLVAVLDSGLALGNPEFAGRVIPGFDFVNEDSNPSDDHGHGTLVTGILAANADNRFGLAGVDHGCMLLPVKVLNSSNGGTTFDLVQGLTYAADAGADVVNMSLINYPGSAALREALRYARDAGCVLVACAGNGGIGDADQSYPGRASQTISVGATTRNDRRATFSGTGEALDLVAPGLDVPATIRQSIDTWVPFSGCSAATPIVSGIASVVLSLAPTLTHGEVKALLENGAEDQVGPAGQDAPGWDEFFGHGRVNLLRTLCGLDAGGPTIVAPSVLRIECPAPGGVAGDDPLVLSALDAVSVFDDLDPSPSLEFEPPGFLPLGEIIPLVFTARDACGKVTQRSADIAAVDTVSPLLELELSIPILARRLGSMISVGLRSKTRDACDPAPALEIGVYADEPAGGAQPDALLDPAGDLGLRAERDAAGDGRVYLCLVRATDDSGNTATSCVTAVVPLDGDERSLAGVRHQAARAEKLCRLTGAPPPGFSVLLEVPLWSDRRTPSARGAR